MQEIYYFAEKIFELNNGKNEASKKDKNVIKSISLYESLYYIYIFALLRSRKETKSQWMQHFSSKKVLLDDLK